VQRLVFHVGVLGEARFLAHLETMNAWIRTLRRARAPMAYSEGFHPHPKVAFARARPVAEETWADHMDVILNEPVDPAELMARVQACVPRGFKVFGVREVPLKSPSLMSQVQGADYAFVVDRPPVDLSARVSRLLEQDELLVERKNKKRKGRKHRWSRRPAMRTLDLKPHLRRIDLLSNGVPMALGAEEDQAVLAVKLDVVEGRGCKPSEMIGLLGLELSNVRVVRLHARLADPKTGSVLSPPVLSEAVLPSAAPAAL
jgi:radical SAM-linked protein